MVFVKRRSGAIRNCYYHGLLGLLVCLSAILNAQTVIRSTTIGPARLLVQNLSWATTVGSPTFFIFTPSIGASGACFTITNNNPTNTHVINPTVFQTSDPNAGTPSFTVGTRWMTTYATAQTTTIGVSNSAVLYVAFSGAVQIALILGNTTSAAGTPDSLDITESDTFYGMPCSNETYGTIGFARVNGSCKQVQTIPAATGTINLVAAVSPPTGSSAGAVSPRWHVCAYAISGAASTTSATLDIGFGNTASTCASIIPRWTVTSPVGIPNYALASTSDIFSMDGTNALCYRDNGTTTGTRLSISYDYY